MTMMGTKGITKMLEPSKWAPWRNIVKDIAKSSRNSLQNLVGIGGAGHLENKYDIADKVGEFMQNPANAAITSDSWDRDPVVFDDVMTEKIQNFRPTPRGPGPWNEFEG